MSKNHKMRARWALQKAVSSGVIVKPDRCQKCSRKIKKHWLQGHHSNYSKPYDVTWLCSLCHGLAHRKKYNTTAAINDKCKRGHQMTKSNSVWFNTKHPTRACRKCKQVSDRANTVRRRIARQALKDIGQ